MENSNEDLQKLNVLKAMNQLQIALQAMGYTKVCLFASLTKGTNISSYIVPEATMNAQETALKLMIINQQTVNNFISLGMI